MCDSQETASRLKRVVLKQLNHEDPHILRGRTGIRFQRHSVNEE
jgi:hypothetical protein